MDTQTLILLPVLASGAILALAAWLSWRHERQNEGGACPSCGYDLRGDVASGCPECGWGWRKSR